MKHAIYECRWHNGQKWQMAEVNAISEEQARTFIEAHDVIVPLDGKDSFEVVYGHEFTVPPYFASPIRDIPPVT